MHWHIESDDIEKLVKKLEANNIEIREKGLRWVKIEFIDLGFAAEIRKSWPNVKDICLRADEGEKTELEC